MDNLTIRMIRKNGMNVSRNIRRMYALYSMPTYNVSDMIRRIEHEMGVTALSSVPTDVFLSNKEFFGVMKQLGSFQILLVHASLSAALALESPECLESVV